MTEEIFHSKCYDWFHNNFHSHRKMLFHVDNNSYNKVVGARKKALGVNAGVSDFILVCDYEVRFIELKIKGGSQSADQREFEEKVKARGHSYMVVWALESDYSDGLEKFKTLIYAALGDGK